MATTRVGAAWKGPQQDIATVAPIDISTGYGADPDADDDRVVFYRVLDDHDEATGQIIGVEIDDFLAFDHWDAIPGGDDLWQLDDQRPMPPVTLLKQLQKRLRAHAQLAHVSN